MKDTDRNIPGPNRENDPITTNPLEPLHNFVQTLRDIYGSEIIEFTDDSIIKNPFKKNKK